MSAATQLEARSTMTEQCTKDSTQHKKRVLSEAIWEPGHFERGQEKPWTISSLRELGWRVTLYCT